MGGPSLSEKFGFDGGALGVDESPIKLATVAPREVSSSRVGRAGSRRKKSLADGPSNNHQKNTQEDNEIEPDSNSARRRLDVALSPVNETKTNSDLLASSQKSISTTLGPLFYRQTTLNTNIARLASIRRVVAEYEKFKVTKAICHFDRRVTAIEWHTDFERFPSTMAIGSKGGDVVWYDHSKSAKQIEEDKNIPKDVDGDLPFLHGQGKGGSITAVWLLKYFYFKLKYSIIVDEVSSRTTKPSLYYLHRRNYLLQRL